MFKKTLENSCRLEKDQLLLYGKRMIDSSFQPIESPYRVWKLTKEGSNFNWIESVQVLRAPKTPSLFYLSFPKVIVEVLKV